MRKLNLRVLNPAISPSADHVLLDHVLERLREPRHLRAARGKARVDDLLRQSGENLQLGDELAQGQLHNFNFAVVHRPPGSTVRVLGGKVACGAQQIGVRVDEGWVWGGVFERNLHWDGLGIRSRAARFCVIRSERGGTKEKRCRIQGKCTRERRRCCFEC